MASRRAGTRNARDRFLDRGRPQGMAANLAGFHKGLAENGYVEGKNVTACCDALWLLAHRAISRQRTVSVAFEAKRTLSRVYEYAR
jgi:hypothetical protein